jgi:hypothetical protein
MIIESDFTEKALIEMIRGSSGGREEAASSSSPAQEGFKLFLRVELAYNEYKIAARVRHRANHFKEIRSCEVGKYE